MSKDVDVIQFRNSDGDYVYTKTHLDAIDGMEEYTEGLTQVAQILGDYIQDSGWKTYDYNKENGVEINGNYTSNGFKCGIREISLNPKAFGNENQFKIKMFRINVRNFSNNMQLFQLPIGFIKTSIRFQMSGNGNRHPYIIEANSDGKVMVFVNKDEQSNSSNSNWIYGQYTWVE